MSFKKGLFNNLLVSGGYNYVSQAITFLSTIITSRLLLPDDYGTVALITVFTGFITNFSDSGISLALIKSNYQFSYYKALDALSIIIGFLLFLITIIASYPIALFYKKNELFIITIALSTTFLFKGATIVREAILTKNLNFNFLGKITLIISSLTVVFTITLALLKMQHWAIIIPQIISPILTFILYEYKTKLGLKLYSIKYIIVAFRKTKSTIKNVVGFSLINYWSRNSDNLIVGKMYGSIDLGIYSRAYNLLTFPIGLITGIFNKIAYASLNKIKGDSKAVENEYLFILKIIKFINFPIGLILILYSHPLILFLWGEKWEKVSFILPYFGLLIFSQTLLSTIGHLLILKNKEKQLFYSGSFSGLIIVTSIIFGSRISLLSIAQFYSLAFISIVLPYHLYFIYIKQLKFNKKNIQMIWLPVIVFSICIWASLYTSHRSFVLIFLLLLLMSNIYSLKNEIIHIYEANLKSRIKSLT